MDFTGYPPDRRGLIIYNYLESLAHSRRRQAGESSSGSEQPTLLENAGGYQMPSGGAAAFVPADHTYPYSAPMLEAVSNSGLHYATEFYGHSQPAPLSIDTTRMMMSHPQVETAGRSRMSSSATLLSSTSSSQSPSSSFSHSSPELPIFSSAVAAQMPSMAQPQSFSSPVAGPSGQQQKTLVDLLGENLATVEKRKAETRSPKGSTSSLASSQPKSPKKSKEHRDRSASIPPCSACNVGFRSSSAFEKHMASKAHQQNIKTFMERMTQNVIFEDDPVRQEFSPEFTPPPRSFTTTPVPMSTSTSLSRSRSSSLAKSPRITMDEVIERRNLKQRTS